MRSFSLLALTALMALASASQATLTAPFAPALTVPAVFKRQTNSESCPASYSACSGLGAPGLCCASDAVCSADQAGHVACCPQGAACTGSITSVVGGTATSAALSTTLSNGLVVASGTTNGVVVVGTSTSAVASGNAAGRVEMVSRS